MSPNMAIEGFRDFSTIIQKIKRENAGNECSFVKMGKIHHKVGVWMK